MLTKTGLMRELEETELIMHALVQEIYSERLRQTHERLLEANPKIGIDDPKVLQAALKLSNVFKATASIRQKWITVCNFRQKFFDAPFIKTKFKSDRDLYEQAHFAWESNDINRIQYPRAIRLLGNLSGQALFVESILYPKRIVAGVGQKAQVRFFAENFFESKKK
jgi:hypothetical protein